MIRAFSALLLLVCVCACVTAERADLPRDFGVKLCGREFIRAVIFTCGGSRWRRAEPEPGGVWLDSDQEDERPWLGSLLRLAGAGADGRSGWTEALFSSAPEGGASYRRRRSFSVGLAGMCCNQGCTKNDIGRLC